MRKTDNLPGAGEQHITQPEANTERQRKPISRLALRSLLRVFRATLAPATNAIKLPVVLCAGLFALTVLSVSTDLIARQNLPQIGEPADAALSPSVERAIGKSFMRQIRASVPLVRDIQVNEYMKSLGARLATNVDNPENHEFTFFVIQNPAINAFAIPGGFIGINSGLIEAMDQEDQLAAVVGHEIAHITQRHHARSVASSKRNRLTAVAAVLAAIIIGQSNPQAGQAALAAGLAASQQSIINFTRTNEYEADRIGIEILADADYRPVAMAEAFEILRRKNNLNASGISQIEYLRTHPLDNTRIAEAGNRAEALPRSNRSVDTLVSFAIFKARIRVGTTRDSGQLERNYRALLDSPDKARRIEATYALTMLDLQKRRFQSAVERIEPLLEQNPDNLNVQLLASRAWFAAGDADKSEKRLTLLASVFPQNYSIINMQVTQFLEKEEPDRARDALRYYLRTSAKPDSFAYRDLANVEQQIGNDSASHEALARYFTELNELGRARAQLVLALRTVNSGTSDQLRLNARLRELDSELQGNR